MAVWKTAKEENKMPETVPYWLFVIAVIAAIISLMLAWNWSKKVERLEKEKASTERFVRGIFDPLPGDEASQPNP